MIFQGDDFPIDRPMDHWVINEQGITITRKIITYYATFQSLIPSLYAPHEFFIGVQYRGAEVEQVPEAGELCMVTLKYDQLYSVPTTGTPKPLYGIDDTTVEVPITLHPRFSSDWATYWDADKQQFNSSAPSYLQNVTKYLAASATIWVKRYYPSDPGGSLPDGTISDPGFGFGPSGHYLILSCSQEKENAFFQRTTRYQYSVTPWPVQIYDT